MRCPACLRETSRLHDGLCRSCADVQEELGAMWGLPTDPKVDWLVFWAWFSAIVSMVSATLSIYFLVR